MYCTEQLNSHESAELRKKANHKYLKLFFFKVLQLRSDSSFLLNFVNCWRDVGTLIFRKLNFFFEIDNCFSQTNHSCIMYVKKVANMNFFC